MTKIQLNLGKLYGFKIVAAEVAQRTAQTRLGAKVGQKDAPCLPTLVGAKLGEKAGIKQAVARA